MNGWDVKTILLGYDGSEGARSAARLAAALARQNDARLIVLTTYHWSYSLDAMGEQARQASGESDRVAGEMASDLRAQGIDAVPEVLEGQAGEVLVRAAGTFEADLIVVGRRGHGRTASLLLGSTSEYVVRRAIVPVLVAH
jgi:nucleotide-binding universal stress UspA family protein